jgi:hypothetical protein
MLYMGPTSALRAPGFKKGRPGNAKVIGMTSMTPRSLAYAAVQVRYDLCAITLILYISRRALHFLRQRLGAALTQMDSITKSSSGSLLTYLTVKMANR